MTREDAIAILTMQKSMVTSGQACCKALDMAIEALSNQNCVKCKYYYEVENKYGIKGRCLQDEAHRMEKRTGEWILECDSEMEGDNLYRCSECGCHYGCQEYDKPNFCPDCGAYMKGGDTE